MEQYITGTGQRLKVHDRFPDCDLNHCCIHSPSDHVMKDFPTHWRADRAFMERICPCGIGHPDPDGISYIRRTLGEQRAIAESVHACCGTHCSETLYNRL